MSDFERMFGAGTDPESLIPGYSGSMAEDMAAKTNAWHYFAGVMLLRSHLAHNDCTIFLSDYNEVKEFDAHASYQCEGGFNFSFTRKREGSGYRVDVNKKQLEALFQRSGTVIITKGNEEAEAFIKERDCPVFNISDGVGRDVGKSKLSNRYNEYRDENELSKEVFWPVLYADGMKDASVFDYLNAGKDIVVCGRGRGAGMELKARFLVWTPQYGLQSPKSCKAYYDQFYIPDPDELPY